MRRTWSRRALSLFAGAVTVAAATLTATATPATAMAGELRVRAPYGSFVLPAATADHPAGPRPLAVGLALESGYQVDGTLTVNTSGLTGVATVSWPEACTPAPDGASASCAVPEIIGWPDYTPVPLKVRADADAQPGAVGSISFSGHVGDLTAAPVTVDVTVGDGPDLTVTPVPHLDGIEPGSRLDLPLRLENNGNQPAAGATVQVHGSYGFTLAEPHPNCTATVSPPTGGWPSSTLVTCTFTQTLEPYTAYRVAPIAWTVTEHALYDRFDLTIRSDSTPPAVAPRSSAARPLTPAAESERLQVADDMNETDNFRVIEVVAHNFADTALSNVTVTGQAGQNVTAPLTIRNNGPAWIASLFEGGPVAMLDFRVPSGVTAVGIPEECAPRGLNDEYVDNRVGAPRYLCRTPYWLDRDTVVDFPFTLRVDTVVPNASGTLTFLTEGPLGVPLPPDPQSGNNVASLVVNPQPN